MASIAYDLLSVTLNINNHEKADSLAFARIAYNMISIGSIVGGVSLSKPAAICT